MIIIAISHGRTTDDPFAHTIICEDEWVDPFNIINLLSFIYKEISVLPSTLDQVLVIEEDQLLASYDNEDGLGSEDQDHQLEIK